MMGGLDGAEILRAALRIAPNVAYFLPRNADERQIAQLAAEAGVPVEIERCRLNGHPKGIMAYFGFEQEVG
jgi:trimethylguanosine synthase